MSTLGEPHQVMTIVKPSDVEVNVFKFIRSSPAAVIFMYLSSPSCMLSANKLIYYEYDIVFNDILIGIKHFAKSIIEDKRSNDILLFHYGCCDLSAESTNYCFICKIVKTFEFVKNVASDRGYQLNTNDQYRKLCISLLRHYPKCYMIKTWVDFGNFLKNLNCKTYNPIKTVTFAECEYEKLYTAIEYIFKKYG